MKTLKQNLSAKLKKKAGFTLVEMLIVVAIIAILIAISIPMISSALERAKHATDAANERSVKAAVLIAYLGEDTGALTQGYYDAVNGVVVADGSKITGYGKHKDHEDDVLAVYYNEANSEVIMKWVAPSSTAIDNTLTMGDDLCSVHNLAHSTT